MIAEPIKVFASHIAHCLDSIYLLTVPYVDDIILSVTLLPIRLISFLSYLIEGGCLTGFQYKRSINRDSGHTLLLLIRSKKCKCTEFISRPYSEKYLRIESFSSIFTLNLSPP